MMRLYDMHCKILNQRFRIVGSLFAMLALLFTACSGSGDLEISRLGSSGNGVPNNDTLGHGALLGNSTANNDNTSAKPVVTPKVFASAGYAHSAVINENGELYTWGNNHKGELGDGTNVGKNSPTKIDNPTSNTNWVSIAGGGDYSLAINTDGELYAWGRNNYGQLGDGTYIDKTSPTKIVAATNWNIIAAGHYHSIAINEDGELYTWGYNGHGHLGDGTYTNRNIPTKIGTATNWVSVVTGGTDKNIPGKIEGIALPNP